MKPEIRSVVWTDVSTGEKTRRWHVWFDDGCGCREEEHFNTFVSALRFAYHVARGGSRWGFVV